jgi:hypothetical protein
VIEGRLGPFYSSAGRDFEEPRDAAIDRAHWPKSEWRKGRAVGGHPWDRVYAEFIVSGLLAGDIGLGKSTEVDRATDETTVTPAAFAIHILKGEDEAGFGRCANWKPL